MQLKVVPTSYRTLVNIFTSREFSYLNFLIDSVQKYISPAAAGGIYREEWPSNARVQSNKSLVILPQTILHEDFAYRPEIETLILSLYNFEVRLVWYEFRRICFSVENEDEICCSVNAFRDEEFEVCSCIWRFSVGVEYKWSHPVFDWRCCYLLCTFLVSFQGKYLEKFRIERS